VSPGVVETLGRVGLADLTGGQLRVLGELGGKKQFARGPSGSASRLRDQGLAWAGDFP